MPVSYIELKTKIDEFNRVQARPDLVLTLDRLSLIQTKMVWQNAGSKGVYFLFNKRKDLLYIGKASLNSDIGKRIGAKFSSRDGHCTDNRFEQATLLATIPLPNDRAYEAPSIEEYLITKLRPPINIAGNRDGN